MINPFEVIEARLSSIENLILKLNSHPVKDSSTNQPEKLLSIKEAGEFLNLSIATLYSKVSKGELPVMKRSKRLYFSRVELMEYIKVGRIKTNSEIDKEAEQYLRKRNTKS